MPSRSIGINLRVTGHCSQGGRKYMEDFFSVAYQQSKNEKDLEYAFFGIYDGHGGSEAAIFAKEHLMNAIVSQKLFWSDCDENILRAIREGYIATHYAMWREQEKWPKTSSGLPSTAGTTATVAFIRHGKIYIGHVGDSGIVLGYQVEGESDWRVEPLTQDHKPECNTEKARIISSGGKVVTKSGVPRVVWNRPRIGHKGPVRRSTLIDEIPFLAVARSLGDLWSYNSALNEFIVSPDPDVKVIEIDPKTFRCLIFGTDGLWNVLKPLEAVEIARDTEILNGKTSYTEKTIEWTNPSKTLVDKALNRWCMRNMRADNTSVVTILLDPLGPPKKDLVENCSNLLYDVDHTVNGSTNINNLICDPLLDMAVNDDYGIENNLDNSIIETANIDNTVHIPANGYTIMTKYDNNCHKDYFCYDNYNNSDVMYTNAIANTSSSQCDVHYMNSFAESYNSLLISSFNEDDDNEKKECSYYSNRSIEEDNQEDVLASTSNTVQNQTQYDSNDDSYSLTKLETRGEQQYNIERNYQQEQNIIFHQFDIDSNYSQYDNITSSYQQAISVQPLKDNIYQIEKESDDFQMMIPQTILETYEEPINSFKCTDIQDQLYSFNNEKEHKNNEEETLIPDDTIQINEISSSVLEPTLSSSSSDLIRVKEPNSSIENSIIQNISETETKIEPRITRSKDLNKNIPKGFIHGTKINVIKNNKCRLHLKEQNENISAFEKRHLRSSNISTSSSIEFKKRTLRSHNTFSKGMKTKLPNEQQSSLICNKPKTQTNNNNKSGSINSFLSASSIKSSPTVTKKFTNSRNSAWCPGKNSVQTRKRVQKELSH